MKSNKGERRIMHVLNPCSGGKNARKYYEAAKRAIEKIGGDMLVSEKPRHITTLLRDLFSRDPYAHAVVYGGDGTVYEAVNGIMQSGNAKTAYFSIIPQGSGNDFSKYANDSGVFGKNAPTPIDLVKTECGGVIRYYANMMNIGFDCDVVRATYSIKKIPFLQGSLAYIAGVAATLTRKKPIPAKLTLDDSVIEEKVLLTACANAQFYGGGFRAAPAASLNDGIMDVLAVRNMSIPRFATLVGTYHDGKHVDGDGKTFEQFEKYLSYHKTRTVKLEGAVYFCLDGEVFPTEGQPVYAEVIPSATNFIAL